VKYVLITPVRNEEAFIGKTLDSVANQTLLPERWVIVNDGSTDKTGEILESFARKHSWVEVVSRSTVQRRSFAGKVYAFNEGLERVRSLEFEVLGNLDGDLSFDRDYLGFLVGKFSEDSQLGVAGTPFVEDAYDSARDSFEGENHVAGGCQMFRRPCFDEIGGYTPNAAGGIDWIAVTTARMKGWRTRSFVEKRFYHYRRLGTAERGVLKALFSYGEKDYYLGGSPVWECFRIAYRLKKKPLVVGSLALMLGYSSAALRRMKRAVSPELMHFHRKEQMRKLNSIVRSILGFKKVEKFTLISDQQKSVE
jgi:glycosyltransferase involved in cell wall biosynthesis